MQRRLRGLIGILCLVYAGFLIGQEQDVRPGINDHFRHPDFAIWVERFEHEGREVYDKRKQIVQAVELKPGMSIADVGAGTGLFSKLFSPAVGAQGKVYAEDISDVFIHNIQRIAREEGLKYVYLGNVHGHKYENTYCPKCGELVIERTIMGVKKFLLKRDLKCTHCGEKIPIHGVKWVPKELWI